MHETAADLATLQALLDQTYARAGQHFLQITTEERRLTAEQVCERLTGMCLLVLATVTRDCRPLNGPVDGIFFRGAFAFFSVLHHAVAGANRVSEEDEENAKHLEENAKQLKERGA